VQLSCPIDSRGPWNSPNVIYTMDLVLERVGRTPTAPGFTASFGCSQCLDSIRQIPPPESGFWAGRRRLPEGCRPLGIVELVRFHQVGCEGSGQVLRVRSAAMDPDAVSTPHLARKKLITRSDPGADPGAITRSDPGALGALGALLLDFIFRTSGYLTGRYRPGLILLEKTRHVTKSLGLSGHLGNVDLVANRCS